MMNNIPVFGFEKPFLDDIKNELDGFASDIYFDNFDNLIACKNKKNKMLIAAAISENAFLINGVTEDGYVNIAPLFEFKSSACNKVTVNNYDGFVIGNDDGSLKIDFGLKDKRAAEKIIKKLGGTTYIKPYIERIGDTFFSNSKSFLLKNILIDIFKNSKTALSCAFIRERKKGAYALGKNISSEISYFISLVDGADLKKPVAFIKKEGDFISDFETDDKPTAVLKEETTYAGSYYLSSGANNIIGVGLSCESLTNGLFKVCIADIDELIKILI